MHINIKIKFLIALLSIIFQANLINAQTVAKIYVAVNGSNEASGTQNQPVQTIEKALELAEKITKDNKAPKIAIIIHGGTYYISNTLQIILDKTWKSVVPLSIEAYKKEPVILHGGKTIPKELIKPVSDKSYLSRFQPQVRNRIREINLKDAGVDPGKLRPVGFGRPFGPSWMEVFVNGMPGQIARWPNKGTVPIDSVINPGSIETAKPLATVKRKELKNALVAIRPDENHKEIIEFRPADTTKKNATVIVADTTKRGGIFYYNDPHPSKWKEPKNVWLTGFFMWGYADDAVPVKRLDTIRRIIETDLPTKYGYGTGKPFRAYYAYNIPEEIDMPGEYYVDTDHGILYFLPPAVLNSVELSVLENPLMEIRGVNNVTIKNLRFTCSRGMGIYMENTKSTRVDGCSFTNLGMMALFMGKGMEAKIDEKKIDSTAQVKIPTNLGKVAVDIINYIYDNTTFDSNAGTDNGIINCTVSQTGAGGIYISGGNRITLTPAHNFVKNCLIHDFNRIEKTYRPGIYIAGVGNSISNCEIYNSPSVAILLHGNNHLIEYNNIHNTTLEVDDMGAIYYGRDPSERGTIVRYNYFHDIGGLNKTMAIYHDDGACGMEVTSNLFFRAGTVAGFIGGGQDNNYTNNVFLNNRYALHIDKRLTNWAKGVVQDKGLFQKRLEAVNYLKPPYSTAYPTLKDYFKEGPATPQRNRFADNVMVNLEKPLEGDTTLIYFDKENFETIGDPGFKNYANENFNIKRKSVIYNKLPDFVALPLKKIGYHQVK